jgi:hypothetical protein
VKGSPEGNDPEESQTRRQCQPPAHGSARAIVAYVPVSLASQQHSAGLAFVPVSDLSPSEVVVAWPDASRSRAVAGFVRAAVEVAGSAPAIVA